MIALGEIHLKLSEAVTGNEMKQSDCQYYNSVDTDIINLGVLNI